LEVDKEVVIAWYANSKQINLCKNGSKMQNVVTVDDDDNQHKQKDLQF
jgi:hypothetical protein